MEIAELFEAKAAWKLYTEHPYGHGLMKTPVTKGEHLPDEDGDTHEFIGISADGKKVIVTKDGKNVEFSPSRFGGKILPANEKPEGPEFEKGKATDPKQWT